MDCLNGNLRHDCLVLVDKLDETEVCPFQDRSLSLPRRRANSGSFRELSRHVPLTYATPSRISALLSATLHSSSSSHNNREDGSLTGKDLGSFLSW
jgi:hypothetical protein